VLDDFLCVVCYEIGPEAAAPAALPHRDGVLTLVAWALFVRHAIRGAASGKASLVPFVRFEAGCVLQCRGFAERIKVELEPDRSSGLQSQIGQPTAPSNFVPLRSDLWLGAKEVNEGESGAARHDGRRASTRVERRRRNSQQEGQPSQTQHRSVGACFGHEKS